jgi:ATP-binding cassette subfamily C protein
MTLATAMTADLYQLLEAEGQPAEVGGNRPLPLDDPDRVWLVCSGQVDVFAAVRPKDDAGGPRRHLLRVGPGQALLGMDLARGGANLDLLAVPGGEVRVASLSRRRLRQLAADPDYQEQVGKLLEAWVVGLSSGVQKGLTPQAVSVLKAEAETLLPEGTCAQPGRGVLWVRHEQGTSRFLGREEAPTGDGDLLLPVSADAWLTAAGECRLSCRETSAALAAEAGWRGLDHFHGLILRCLLRDQERENEARARRLEAKADQDRVAVAGGLGALASVLLGRLPPGLEGPLADPLLAVCQAVGAAQGIDIYPAPSAAGTGRGRRDPLEDIVQASRIRKRRVALRGTWWREDNGPLVAHLAEDGRPVAILPTSPGTCELYDVVARTRTRVTDAVAARLEPLAYRFYRTLPARALRVRDLVRFCARGNRADLSRVVLMGILGGVLGLVTPVATGILFDAVIPGAQRFQLVQLSLGLVVAALAAVLFQVVRGLAVLRLRGRLGATLEAAVWDRLLTLPSGFFRAYEAGDLAQRAMGVAAIEAALTGTALSAILSGVFSVLNLLLLFWYSVRLALLAVGLVVVVVVTTATLGYRQLRQQGDHLWWFGRIASMLLQFLNGIAKLRVAGAEDRAFAQWAWAFAQQRRAALRIRAGNNLQATLNVLFPVLCSLTLYAAVGSAAEGTLRTGSFLAFSAAFGGLLSAALSLASAILAAVPIVPLYRRMRPILDAVPEVDEARASPGALTGDIDVVGVSFRYAAGGPPVLADVSLRCRPGEFIALVGPSGCGKSTLLRLLLGFEMPEAGTISYDGKDLATLDLRAVRRQIGVVLQNSRLLPGSILDNIVGSFHLTLEDAWEAARMAGLEDDIKQMPMGMQTVIAEGASTLSGGQRQRLVIARAVVNRPRILFFDEATSALDNQTQAVVSRSLEQLKCTRVVIAHRLSTIQNADRIYVLERGRIVASGTYRELVNQPGPFAELARRQVL